MAVSDVKIANRALQMLGATRISALDQNHPNARSMDAAYVPVRDALLEEYDWNFAIKRASVAKDSSQTAWGDLNRYLLPNDFIRLMRNKEIDDTDTRHDWQVEGGHIITSDGSPLQFRYIAQITDPRLHSPLFDEAFAAKLAMETCEEITQSNSKAARAQAFFDDAIAKARRANAIQNDVETPEEDDWVASMR